MRRVVVISGDPGGGAALVPVIRRISTMPEFDVRILAYRQSLELFRKNGFDVEAIGKTADAAHWMDLVSPDCVLASTSCNGLDLEKVFVQEAGQRLVFSLSFVDFWSNYRLRYKSGTDFVLPAAIAVVDERMKSEMVETGFPSGIVHVTGHPAHGNLEARREAFSKIPAEAARNQFGISDLGVLFISQPVFPEKDSPDFDRAHRGFSKETVLPEFIRALEQVAVRSGRNVSLLIRPHPREAEDDFSTFTSGKIGIRICRDGAVDEILRAVDLVAGMDSALMLDACLLGCVVFSLQPGLNRTDALPSNRWGLSWPAYSKDAFSSGLEKTLFDTRWRKHCSANGIAWKMEGNAVSHIVNLLQQSHPAQSTRCL